MPRLALAVSGLVAATLLTAAAPRPGAATPRPTAAAEPAPSGVAPPADDAVIVGSCQVSREQCIDYEGSFATGEAQARCKMARGAWRDEPCAAEGRIGTCTVRDTGTDNRVLTRFLKPATEKAARAECKKVPRAVYLAR
jgi:hypothetical protein